MFHAFDSQNCVAASWTTTQKRQLSRANIVDFEFIGPCREVPSDNPLQLIPKERGICLASNPIVDANHGELGVDDKR